MEKIFIYPLQVTICSAILFGYYLLALRNKRFHYYNRFYLLAVFIISLAVPLLKLEWFYVQPASNKTIAWLQEITIPGTTATTGFWEKYANVHTLAYTIFFLVAIVGILSLVGRVRKIFAIRKKFHVEKMQEVELISTDMPEAPFSFLNMLFWRNDISLQEDTGQQVLKHELTHIREKHTWDKLFVQIVLCFYWYNPFYYFMQKELYLVHEFIADEKAVADKGTSALAAMLLQARFGKNIFSPAQSFFYSPIKRRILMLTISKKTTHSYFRRLMVLPLLAFTVLLFAFKMQEKKTETPESKFNLSAFSFLQDTVPYYGKLNGKKIYSVRVTPATPVVTITLEDNTIKTLTMEEAKALNIPLPPPPTADKESITIKADTVFLHQDKEQKYNDVTLKLQGPISPSPLYILDGKPIEQEALKSESPSHLQSIVVLKGAEATNKYGDKGKNGVIELYTKKENSITENEAQENIFNSKEFKVENVLLQKINETPAFPGGQKAWLAFLQQHLNTDYLLKAHAPVGTYTVILSFTVDKDGSLLNIKPNNDPGYGAATEALKVMYQSPKWLPAMKDGKAIAMQVKQPITFKITE